MDYQEMVISQNHKLCMIAKAELFTIQQQTKQKQFTSSHQAKILETKITTQKLATLCTLIHRQLIEGLHYCFGLASDKSTSWLTYLATLFNLGMGLCG
jgi:hypothetical protein